MSSYKITNSDTFRNNIRNKLDNLKRNICLYKKKMYIMVYEKNINKLNKIKSTYIAEELEAISERMHNSLRSMQDVAGDAALSLERIKLLDDAEEISEIGRAHV